MEWKCPICGEYAFKEKGDYDICHVCLWQNDLLAHNSPYEVYDYNAA